MNLDDKSLFLDAMEDVQPLKRAMSTGIQRVTNVRRSVSTRCSLIISSPPDFSTSSH